MRSYFNLRIMLSLGSNYDLTVVLMGETPLIDIFTICNITDSYYLLYKNSIIYIDYCMYFLYDEVWI
jgi:hypothetical protein